MMTCLRWILGYTRLEIWRKIGLSADYYLCPALPLVVVHAVCCVCVSVCLPQVYFWNYTFSEVTTFWCYTNLFIIVIVIIIYSVL